MKEKVGYADPALGKLMAEEVLEEIKFVRSGGTHPTYQKAVDALVLALARKKKKRTLLDVGCGIGLYCAVVQEAGLNVAYEGADYSETMIEIARREFPGIKFHLADALELPFRKNQFDIVLAGALLAHIAEWQKALKELCRVAKSHLVWHRATLSPDGMGTRSTQILHGNYPVLRIHFSQGDIERELRENGFEIQESWFVRRGGNYLQRTFLCRRTDGAKHRGR